MGQKVESRRLRVGGAINDISLLLSEAECGGSGYCARDDNIDTLVETIQKVLAEKHGHHTKDVENMEAISLVTECFDRYDRQCTQQDEERQFEATESFIINEQISSAARRESARRLEAEEEMRLAAEIARIKGFREGTKHAYQREELQRKISDAERSYFSRKMVVTKASQIASSECRLQFASVREFFEQIHTLKKENLSREHQRSMRRLEITHRLKKSDARVRALEVQIADRVYKKKLQDLNELHIAQNMEEAIYMESMLDLLDNVQAGKENAAKEVFELHVTHLRERQLSDSRRTDELSKFQAEATAEIATLIASYFKDDKDNEAALQKREEDVEAMERRKGYGSMKKQTLSVGELYDTVLWSVVKNHCGLTSSDSDYSSDYTFEEEDEEENATNEVPEEANDNGGFWYDNASTHDHHFDDRASCSDASVGGGSVGGSSSRRADNLSSAGNMHVKQLTRQLRDREKELIKRHKQEERRERTQHRNAVKSMKRKHQLIIEGLIEKCLIERESIRDKIEKRMADLVHRQERATKELRETVVRDAEVLQDALRAEDKRVEDAETESFSKAQTMISAQVFHEVRNALSSVIAMSEIAYSMKKDAAVSADQLVSSVEDMLDQIKEVVDYALKMLNNVLDISKITSGTFQLNSEPFDLQDLVARATRMQLAKAGRIKMTFSPHPQPSIAFADSDIVVRIVTNLISNAIKFSTVGGVQPFVCPLEDIVTDPHEREKIISNQCSFINLKDNAAGELEIPNKSKRHVAVGVADTGSGLSKRKLKAAETAVSQCDPKSVASAHGVRNSGFGLYLIHLLARALGSRLQLTSLENCRKVLNSDMLSAIEERKRQAIVVSSDNSRNQDGFDRRPSKPALVPGKGSVLYITLQVYQDGECAKDALEERKEFDISLRGCDAESSRRYTFRPQPSRYGNGSFRILVADDVLMLRKGILNAIACVFKDCPVSISTACTAEDLLRAVRQNPYDMIICDNLFHHDASKLRRIESCDEYGLHGRPQVYLDSKSNSKKEIREHLSEYFTKESFTLEDGDGELTGIEAIVKIAHDNDPLYPAPILMLLSGNTIEVPPDSGIIVAQKPLKQDEFIKVLESSAAKLIEAGMCTEEDPASPGTVSSTCSETASLTSDSENQYVSSETSTAPVVNCHGTQIFISQC